MAPPSIFVGAGNETCKLSSIRVRKGKVVRICINRDSSKITYGIVFIDENKNEERVPINGIDDIYDYAEKIIATVQRYDAE